MSEGNHYESEMSRLHIAAAQARLRVIESQLSLGLTLCAVAETEILYGRIGEARRVTEKVRRAVDSARYHIDEPNHVPASSTADLRDQLAKLKKRLAAVESKITTHDVINRHIVNMRFLFSRNGE